MYSQPIFYDVYTHSSSLLGTLTFGMVWAHTAEHNLFSPSMGSYIFFQAFTHFGGKLSMKDERKRGYRAICTLMGSMQRNADTQVQ